MDFQSKKRGGTAKASLVTIFDQSLFSQTQIDHFQSSFHYDLENVLNFIPAAKSADIFEKEENKESYMIL